MVSRLKKKFEKPLFTVLAYDSSCSYGGCYSITNALVFQAISVDPSRKASKRLRDAVVRTRGQVVETMAHSDDANINQVNLYPGCPSDLRHLRQ